MCSSSSPVIKREQQRQQGLRKQRAKLAGGRAEVGPGSVRGFYKYDSSVNGSLPSPAFRGPDAIGRRRQSVKQASRTAPGRVVPAAARLCACTEQPSATVSHAMLTPTAKTLSWGKVHSSRHA
jgi:hypothetical protein